MAHENADPSTPVRSFSPDQNRANGIPESRDANAARLREMAAAIWPPRAFPAAISPRQIAEALKGAALELERTTVEAERIPDLFDAAGMYTEDPRLLQVLADIEHAFERVAIERDRQQQRADYLENCGAVQRAREEYRTVAEKRQAEDAEFHRGTDFEAIRKANMAAIPADERERLAMEDARWEECERRRS